ncbi:MAG: ChaN family lipoprotein, partial [Desulfovibrionales bacterium]|nr:ChaN family lipoprotein [Desulfovibrionales bacterium]
MQKRYLPVLLVLLFFLQSCAVTPPPKPTPPKDPLIGKILDTHSGQLIPFNALVEGLGDSDIIYLSEKHNNPMHHEIQHRIIQSLVDNGKKPSLGFEFFSVDQTPLLLNFVEFNPKAHKRALKKMGKTM